MVAEFRSGARHWQPSVLDKASSTQEQRVRECGRLLNQQTIFDLFLVKGVLDVELLLNLKKVCQVIHDKLLKLCLVLDPFELCAPLIYVVLSIVEGQIPIVHERNRNPGQYHQQDQDQHPTALWHWDFPIVLSGFELVSLINAVQASEGLQEFSVSVQYLIITGKVPEDLLRVLFSICTILKFALLLQSVVLDSVELLSEAQVCKIGLLGKVA